jgi:hypothetical protein
VWQDQVVVKLFPDGAVEQRASYLLGARAAAAPVHTPASALLTPRLQLCAHREMPPTGDHSDLACICTKGHCAQVASFVLSLMFVCYCVAPREQNQFLHSFGAARLRRCSVPVQCPSSANSAHT